MQAQPSRVRDPGPAIPTAMTAARARGGPEAIVVERAPVPVIEPADVLVAVGVAAITPSELDWVPTWTHPDGTARTPIIPGHEACGTVALLGSAVKGLAVGTPVFGLTGKISGRARGDDPESGQRDTPRPVARLDAPARDDWRIGANR